jgi:putative glutathione S-transferase
MGLLIDGEWSEQGYDSDAHSGRFVREESCFRDEIRADGGARFAPEIGRYHLYVSYACPWAHRTLIARRLKKLERAISVSVVHPYMGREGWSFREAPGATGDGLHGARFLRESYLRADPHATGRVTVPVLWDKREDTIVNNESADILRMLNSEFDGLAEGIGNPQLDLYPPELRDEIDALNSFVYPFVNNGVYRCGFATTQGAYEEAFDQLFWALDLLDERLAERRYLCGARISEADWRLFTTLVRFDAVYVGHFKCNRRRIADYAQLSGYLRELYQWEGIAETVDFDHIKQHYYRSHRAINPTRVVPRGPELDLDAPHGRGGLSATS